MADRFDKFTEHARRVLTLAQEEALRFNHNYIGTEHLVLGLIREQQGVAAMALWNLGVELSRVREAVEFIIGRGDRAVIGEIGLTPPAMKVIKLAVDEARRMHSGYVGTEHILLGLVREGEGIAAGVLESLGVTLNQVRAEVERVLQLPPEERKSPEPPFLAINLKSREIPWTADFLSRGLLVGTTNAPPWFGHLRYPPADDIDGKAIAETVRAEVAGRARKLKDERDITPGLALVLVGDNPSSLSYVRSKGDTAEQAGLYSDMFHLPENTEEERLISLIQDLNADARFHGILVQLPLPGHINENRAIGAIDPQKDADGVTAESMGRLVRGEPTPWPATPAGIVELLHRSGNAPSGKHVVVCGRSNIVGKPIANILMQKSDRANATVTLCHTGTPDLGYFTRQADILISAMGVPRVITADMVKPGAVVIDVGNNWIEDETRKSGRRLVGDVDYDAVRYVASALTPVPGGVGPMTIAMLLSNTVWLAERYGQRA